MVADKAFPTLNLFPVAAFPHFDAWFSGTSPCEDARRLRCPRTAITPHSQSERSLDPGAIM